MTMWVLNGLNQPQHTGPKKSVQSPTNYNLTVAFVLGTKNLFRSLQHIPNLTDFGVLAASTSIAT